MSFEFEAEFFSQLLARYGVSPARTLVIGCGTGLEAVSIARRVGSKVVGLDLQVPAAGGSTPGVSLVWGDAETLCFPDAVFDAVYCFHVLEHLRDPVRGVSEICRVLSSSGAAFVGTPNKGRLIGYLGGRATLWEKVAWNFRDLSMRLRGRWANELGAHAGFRASELEALLGGAFTCVEAVSRLYYCAKYECCAALLGRLTETPAFSFVFPSVYFVARKGEASGPERGRNAVLAKVQLTPEAREESKLGNPSGSGDPCRKAAG